ncbi:MAG TPA: hypothetical protein VGG22_13170 [Candidatus Baltobacteraceae bacterium]
MRVLGLLLATALLVGRPATAAVPVEAHVPTAAYCCHGYANDTVAPSSAAPYLTWAATPDNPGADADRAAGIQNIYRYVDVFKVYQGDHLYAAVDGGKYAATRATNCGGVLIRTESPPGYLTNPRSPQTLNLLDEELAYRYYPAYNAYFIDDADAYRYGLTNGPPCIGNTPWPEPATAEQDATLLAAARIQVAGRSIVPNLIFNGLSDYVDKGDQYTVPLAMLKPANVLGGMCEECFAGNKPDKVTYDTEWRDDLGLEIKTERMRKIFWLYVRYIANNPAARAYTFASYMLAWDPKFSVYQTAYAPNQAGQLHVTPETQLVAHDPLKGNIESVDELRDPAGTYVREYAHCYYRRSPIGGCAFVVNSDRSAARSRPHLAQNYNHTAALHGGMVLEGGTLSFDGPPMPGSLAPTTGYILTR